MSDTDKPLAPPDLLSPDAAPATPGARERVPPPEDASWDLSDDGEAGAAAAAASAPPPPVTDAPPTSRPPRRKGGKKADAAPPPPPAAAPAAAPPAPDAPPPPPPYGPAEKEADAREWIELADQFVTMQAAKALGPNHPAVQSCPLAPEETTRLSQKLAKCLGDSSPISPEVACVISFAMVFGPRVLGVGAAIREKAEAEQERKKRAAEAAERGGDAADRARVVGGGATKGAA